MHKSNLEVPCSPRVAALKMWELWEVAVREAGAMRMQLPNTNGTLDSDLTLTFLACSGLDLRSKSHAWLQSLLHEAEQ